MDMLVHHAHDATDLPANRRGDAPGGLKDPVCGMAVTTDAVNTLVHDGRPFYFCSAACQSKFAADPQAYIAKQAAPLSSDSPVPTAAEGAIYTCPMHPEIRQAQPGEIGRAHV